MARIFAELEFDTPTTVDALRSQVTGAARCFELHRVALEASVVVGGGRGVLARFEAPDAESVRIAVRRAGLHAAAVWTA